MWYKNKAFYDALLLEDFCMQWLWFCHVWNCWLRWERVVLFVVILLKMIDFTGIFNDFEVRFKWYLKCCFIIIYGIFSEVRLMIEFSRVWWDFLCDIGGFDYVKSDEDAWFWWVCSKLVSKWYLIVALVKWLENADFTRGLWIEQMCRFTWRTNVLKM